MSQQFIDKNVVLLTGDIEGSFMPALESEVLRDAILKDKFQMNGSLYAQNLRVEGEGVVTGSVMTAKEITVKLEKGKLPRFMSGLNAVESVATENAFIPISESVVSDLKKTSLFVKGDIISDFVKLENALIIGNIRANRVVLTNSILIGSVFSEDDAVISNSAFLAFSAGKITLKGKCSCWLPYGMSVQPIAFEPFTTSDGKEIPSMLRYFGLCKPMYPTEFAQGKITYNLMEGNPQDREVTIGGFDIQEHHTESGETFFALTLAKRALNLAPVQQQLEKIEKFVADLLLYEHLDEESKVLVRSEWDKNYTLEEREILKLVA